MHWNYEYYTAKGEGPFGDSPDMVKRHVNHCLDMLRQVIQCQPDTGVFGQYWVKELKHPFVDFHTSHKCKNFEQLSHWVMDHQEVEEVLVALRPGDIVLDVIP
jgi:hypothetical protein